MMPLPAGTSRSWRTPAQSPRPPRSGYWPRCSSRTPARPGCWGDVAGQVRAVRARASLTGQFASVDEDPTGAENLVMIARLLGHPRWRAARLPGTAVPAEPAPMLPLTLGLAGAARGQLGGVAVTMFAYRAPSGERLTILVASRPFPEPGHARELGGAEGAWTMQSSGITNICAQHTHAMLLLGSDPVLICRAGTLLNAI
jgi:hypothetical protein